MNRKNTVTLSQAQVDAHMAKFKRAPAARPSVAKDGVSLTGLERFQAIGRAPQSKLNDTEQEYADMLDVKKTTGEVLWWKAHPFNVKLANNTFYRIDFLVLLGDGRLQIHETKGEYITDKGMMKIKLCNEALPVIPIVLCQKTKTGWTFKEFQ